MNLPAATTRVLAGTILALSMAGGATLSGQVRQLRLVPDSGFDASAIELTERPNLRVDHQNRVYLTDLATARLLRLSPDGRKAEVLARKGSGRGEAHGFTSLEWKGDTLWFYDNWLARFTLLNVEGKFIRTIPYNERCHSTGPWSLMAGDACLDAVRTRSPFAKATEPTQPISMIYMSRHQNRVDTVGSLLFAHDYMQFDQRDGMSVHPQPFGDGSLIAAFQRGAALFELIRGAASHPQPDSVTIRSWTPGNGWGDRKAIQYTPRPLESSTIDSALKARVAHFPRMFSWVTLDSLRKKAYRPRYYPPSPSVVTTGDGGLWLQLIQADDPPGTTSWVVLDTMLRETARIVAPANLHVLEAKGDFCWGYILDEDDVPQIVRYRIVPGD